jgi:hypothetical protein
MKYAIASMNSQLESRQQLLFRKPRRITITVPHHIYLTLHERSTSEGRSFSNLAAYLLECAVAAEKAG